MHDFKYENDINYVVIDKPRVIIYVILLVVNHA